MNLLDAAIVGWIVLAAIAGYRRGAALQLTEYAGLFVGLAIGAVVAPKVAVFASSPVTQAAVALVALLALAAAGEAVGWIVGHRVWAVARRSILRGVDAIGGSLVSVVAVLLVTWFVGYSLNSGPIPSLAHEINSSAIVRPLNDVMPRPPAILADVRRFLDRFGFPQVFADLPPVPAGPVQPPTDAVVRAIAATADPSVVKVVGEACGQILSGTGFVGASHYVITNAHVVAGESSTHVDQGGRTFPATAVLFDPRVDVAVLFVPAFDAPALRLDAKETARGTQGAAIGHPGGGPLVALPGGVRRALDALGRDIYGGSVVTRRIYELQSVIKPGDSGGPFVLRDGEVAGVVFAASTSDQNIGYALTSPIVLPLVARADVLTAPVSTGGCAR
jgi:S1-C subfamily serine protease